MSKSSDPFAIKEYGGDIHDRSVSGFSWRAYEGTSLGEPGVGTLKRVITQKVPLVGIVLIVLFFAILLFRIFQLQIINGAYWGRIAEGNRIRLEIMEPNRGEVVDRQGKILATNQPSFRLVTTPADLPRSEVERQALLNDLLADVPTELLNQETLSKLPLQSYLPQIIASQLPRDLALKLMVRTATLPGVRVEVVSERSYPEKSILAHVLGYVGKISPEEYQNKNENNNYQFTSNVGKSGLEYQYESSLRGIPGKKEVEVDARGKETKIYAAQVPEQGNKLKLTLDLDLQRLAYANLESTVLSVGGVNGGSVVALDPRNGNILALASYPSFDPNIFISGVVRDQEKIKDLLNNKRQPLFNRVLSGEYPPGSTIKPFLAAAALAEAIVTPQTTFISTGGIQLGNKFFADWKKGGHGAVNIYSAIAESVNTYFYLIGGGSPDRRGLGVTLIDKYLQKFHFSEKPKIDLPSARPGFIPDPNWKLAQTKDRWYLGDTYNLSIGQGGLLVTPLQLAIGYASLLTEGRVFSPRLVSGIVYPDNTNKTYQPSIVDQIKLSPEIWTIIKTAMRQTVTSGSARSLGVVSLPVAGKTGTAQTGTRTNTHAWFAGYLPADQPEFLVVVMIEHGGEGSSVAVPIAHNLFNWYTTHRSEFTSSVSQSGVNKPEI